jgi:hypothetical protein
MSSEDTLYTVLEFILNRATSAELEVIAEALNRRQKPGQSLGGISPRGMAENVAQQVRRQLGGMLDVHTIARQIVTDLIRQKEPAISDEELGVLLNNWLPGSSGAGAGGSAGPEQSQAPAAIPPDTLITMVSQYVSARKGTLSAEEQSGLPENWQTRYWESFPQEIKADIRAHLNGRLGEVDFWQSVISSLNR